MIIRVVRMTFEPGKVEEFLVIFNGARDRIRHFEGCLHLDLWQDVDAPNVYTTCSHWQSAADLENYRQSTLFKTTWAQTKVLFAEKAVAFSNKICP